MGQMIDISSKITNQLPVVKITDEIVVTVNNRKSTILNVRAMVNENEIKVKKGAEVSETEFMSKGLSMLIGEKNANAIEEMDLPLPEYKEVFNTIMAVAGGTYGQTPITK